MRRPVVIDISADEWKEFKAGCVQHNASMKQMIGDLIRWRLMEWRASKPEGTSFVRIPGDPDENNAAVARPRGRSQS
jgi:hypothetical protein